MTPIRAALLLVALLSAAGAWLVSERELVFEPDVITTWRAEHVDDRPLTAAQESEFRAIRGATRRQDLLLLLAALAVGALAVAVWPAAARTAGGTVPAVLALGAVVLLGWSLSMSVNNQIHRAVAGEWTLSDDAFESFTGPLASLLADYRERIPEDEAVILVGVDPFALNVASWALYPRPMYMLVRPIPQTYTLFQVRDEIAGTALAADHPGRWVVHVTVMAQGGAERTGRADLLKVDE